MSNFCIETTVKKGLADDEILKNVGFIKINIGQDGKKTAFKDRIFYAGLNVTTKDIDEEHTTATITYSSIEYAKYEYDPLAVKSKK